MTDYKTIRGKKVKFFTSDLSGGEAEGQLFFQDTAREMKVAVASAAWSSGSPINSGRLNCASGSTPRDAGIIFGGFLSPASSTLTEEYNGSGWTEDGNLNTARQQFPGFGTQTAAVGAGGYVNGSGDVANVEEYDGSSWTEVTDIPSARRGQAGFGTLTAGVICGGVPNSNQTFEYDGTNWTAGGNLGTGMDRTDTAGAGTQTAGLVASGDTTESFTYNGTAWTDVGATNSPHDGGSDTGLQTAAVVISGFPAPQSPSITTACETFDGTSFSTTATVAQGAYGMGNGGASGTAAFKCTGDANPGTLTGMEEFNITVNTVTAAAWASGGNYPTNNYGLQGAGSQTAALAWGGDAAGATTNVTAEYNGSSWTTSGNYPFNGWRIGGDGTQTAAIGSGGVNNSADFQPSTNTYDGSSWTDSGNDLPANRRSHAMVGTQTSALVFAGSPTTTTLEYNGSSYSSAPALATPRAGMHALGTQTAALCGATPPNSASEEYNGSSWSTGGSQVKATGSSAEGNGTGTQTAGMFVGGYPSQVTTQLYDGTIFTTAANLGSAGYGLGQSSSSSTAALAFGGFRGGYSNSTEEFTGETTSLNLKTITDS